MRFALAHSKFYPFPPLPPPTNAGSVVCIMATTRFHIFLYAISARQPTLQGGGRGGERMRLCIYQKFPLYPVKRQFPILSQNNYSMIVALSSTELSEFKFPLRRPAVFSQTPILCSPILCSSCVPSTVAASKRCFFTLTRPQCIAIKDGVAINKN